MKRFQKNPDYSVFKDTVLKRDNYMCQMPYCESKRHLVVHHIRRYAKSPNLRTNEDNGITLCNKCHKSIFGKEKSFAKLFLTIIKEKHNGNSNDNNKKT